jgi:hypothetical protein
LLIAFLWTNLVIICRSPNIAACCVTLSLYYLKEAEFSVSVNLDRKLKINAQQIIKNRTTVFLCQKKLPLDHHHHHRPRRRCCHHHHHQNIKLSFQNFSGIQRECSVEF